MSKKRRKRKLINFQLSDQEKAILSGKTPPKIQEEAKSPQYYWNQMMRVLPRSFKPDFGHYVLLQEVDSIVLNQLFLPTYIFFDSDYGFLLNFTTSSFDDDEEQRYAASIFASQEDLRTLKLDNYPLNTCLVDNQQCDGYFRVFSLKPVLKERYLSKDKKQWIIPLSIENCFIRELDGVFTL